MKLVHPENRTQTSSNPQPLPETRIFVIDFLMLCDPLLKLARSEPDRLAIIDDCARLTYGQLATSASRVAAHLVRRSNSRPIALMLPGSSGFVNAFFGALLAGRTVAPLNLLLPPEHKAAAMDDCGAEVIITNEALRPAADALGRTVLTIETLLGTAPNASWNPADRKPMAPDDLAVLLYTSGTSGNPKGVCLTCGNLLTNVEDCIRYARMNRNHRFLGVLPLFHSFGMTTTMLAPLILGAEVMYRSGFHPTQMIADIHEHRISIVMAVASMYAALLRVKSASAKDFSSVYLTVSGGEALPRGVYDAFLKRFDVPILEGYGLTETSPVVSLNTPWAHAVGTVGKPLPRVEIRIVNEEGDELPSDQTGEILLRGPSISPGYWNRLDETAAAFRNGWFHTGDLGCLEADGYLVIRGRKKEMLIVAGQNVFPREIEEVLRGCPDVSEAAVLGRPDPHRGELPVAFVIPTPDTPLDKTALRRFCRGKLSNYKIPRHIFIHNTLPRSATGKILKRALDPTTGNLIAPSQLGG